jgi:hypothetical protein
MVEISGRGTIFVGEWRASDPSRTHSRRVSRPRTDHDAMGTLALKAHRIPEGPVSPGALCQTQNCPTLRDGKYLPARASCGRRVGKIENCDGDGPVASGCLSNAPSSAQAVPGAVPGAVLKHTNFRQDRFMILVRVDPGYARLHLRMS